METNGGSLISNQLQHLSLSAGDDDKAASVENSALLMSTTSAQFDGQMVPQQMQSLSPGLSASMAMLRSERPAPRGGSVRDNRAFNLLLYG